MEPIRVLQVFTIMNRGGAETMIMNYYRHIDREKVQFDFLVHRSEKAAYDDEIEQLGGRIYKLPKINPFYPNTYYKALHQFFKQHSYYYIVHSHLNTFSGFPLKIAEKFNIPHRIAHAHIAIDPIKLNTLINGKENLKETLKKIVKNRLKNKTKKHTTHFFSCGKKAGQWLFGVTTPFKIMNNAIDVDRFIYQPEVESEYRKKLKLQGQWVLGHIGGFSSQKNHEFLLRIFASVLTKKSNAVLLLVGEGPLRKKYEQMAKDMQIDHRVVFTGVRSDIAQLCQVMDTFVFPSFYEGLPVALIEAQAAGIPAVISDIITSEVCFTNNITRLSLNAPITVWVNEILKLYHIKASKKNQKKEIVAHHFDIKSNAQQMEAFYQNLSSFKNEKTTT